ncbi:MAG: DUF4202 domain-containing protein [Verrucomicrobiota bacterium]
MNDSELLKKLAGGLEKGARFEEAILAFDRMNDEDPNRVEDGEGRHEGYELWFSKQLLNTVVELRPDASEALLLAARSQHICRWMMPRSDFPMDRAGYLKWRSDLKRYHAKKAGDVLSELGYDEETIGRVKDLNLKKGIKSDPECQTLEDALCLVFLGKQFADFRHKTSEEKMISILRKTWGKMSEQGQEAALKLDLGDEEARLVKLALEG